MIEIIISIGIASAMLVTFESLIVQSIWTNDAAIKRFQANMYLREIIEISKDLEQSRWNEFASCPVSSVCHPEISGGKWILAAGPESLEEGKYSRSMTIEEVFRDQLEFPNAIVIKEGVLDPNTLKIIATITWHEKLQQYNSSLETYVYNNY